MVTFWERVLPGLAAYPNIHPLVVHLPVVMLPLALLLALLSLRERSPAREGDAASTFFTGPAAARLARLLFLLGLAGAIAAALTGLLAARAFPHGRGSLVALHRNIMLATAVIAALIAVWARREAAVVSVGGRRRLAAALLLVNAGLIVGADRGALVALRVLGVASLPDASRASGEVNPPGAVTSAGFIGEAARGRVLYEQLRCATCHDRDRREEAPGIPPSLEFAGSRLRPEWMRDYLLTPAPRRWADGDRRPVVRMPDFHLSAGEAGDLAAFLAARTDSAAYPKSPVTEPPLSSQEAVHGRELVAEYACLGCHQIARAGSHLGPTLDGAGDRLEAQYVYALLKDPQRVVPGTPMKNFHLWDEEARALTAYLMTLDGD